MEAREEQEQEEGARFVRWCVLILIASLMGKELDEMSSHQCSEEPPSDPKELLSAKTDETPRCEEERTKTDEPEISSLSTAIQKGLSAEDSLDEMAMTPDKDGASDAVKEDRLVMKDENGRERLKRHRSEVAGRVWIPDVWGQEDLLKDLVDCSAFDSPLVLGNIMSARTALVEEVRRANSSGLRIENRC